MSLFDEYISTDKRLFATATARKYIKSSQKLTILGNKRRSDGAYSLISKGENTSGNRNKKNRSDSERGTIPVPENVCSLLDESLSGQCITIPIPGNARSLLDETLSGQCITIPVPGNVRSLLDESLSGQRIVKQTQRESVEQNSTLPITLCAMDRKEILSLVGPSGMDLRKDMTSRESLLSFAIQAAFTKFNVSHAVSFHSYDKRAREFVTSAKETLRDAIAVFCVDGTMSAKERDQILENAKREPRSIVSSCRLLPTGVNEANWEMVVLADPIRGQVNTRQMIERVTRKAPNKERGYILVPILSETEYDASEEMLETSGGFSVFLSAFNTMVGLDPQLREDVLSVIDETSRLGRDLMGEEFPQRVRECFMLPSSMSYEMKAAVMNRAIIEFRNENTWDKMFDLLLAYRERESHCNVPYSHKEDGMNLGVWLNYQRKAKEKGELDDSLER